MAQPGGRAAARERSMADRGGEAMGGRRRTARRVQIEALECRWAPGAGGGGVIMACGITRSIGEEISQAQVVSGSKPGGAGDGLDGSPGSEPGGVGGEG